MPGRIKFHLDENVGNAIAQGLKLRGIDVSTTPLSNLIGSSDEQQLAFAVSQRRVVFTQDKDFLRLHSVSKDHAGITYCQKGLRATGEIIEGLYLIWECMDSDDIAGQVEFI